jgi:hypothetical protein
MMVGCNQNKFTTRYEFEKYSNSDTAKITKKRVQMIMILNNIRRNEMRLLRGGNTKSMKIE